MKLGYAIVLCFYYWGLRGELGQRLCINIYSVHFPEYFIPPPPTFPMCHSGRERRRRGNPVRERVCFYACRKWKPYVGDEGGWEGRFLLGGERGAEEEGLQQGVRVCVSFCMPCVRCRLRWLLWRVCVLVWCWCDAVGVGYIGWSKCLLRWFIVGCVGMVEGCFMFFTVQFWSAVVWSE